LTPEQLDSLRAELPPFGEEVDSSPELQTYLSFYKINFVEQNLAVDHDFGTIDSGLYQLAVHRWQHRDAVANLLIVHGYYDHTGLFGRLIEWGLRHGCNVVAFDLPGHGLSTGEPAEIQNFSEYAEAVYHVLEKVDLPALPIWAMGQSTGCAALIEFARRYTWPFAATVMLAPLVRPFGWRGITFAHTFLNPFIDSLGRKFANNTGDRDFLKFIERDPLQCRRVPLIWIKALRAWLADLEFRALDAGSLLIVQGDKDFTVDWRYNTGKVQKLFPESQIEYMSGAGHQLANETVAVREKYFAKVLGYLREEDIELRPGA
jgi:alpha-beta hydrolase superfamily lysophospholipase